MLESRLIQLLKTLSSRELQKLEAFLQLDDSRQEHKNLSLFLEIRKFAPRFKHKSLKKETFLKTCLNTREWTDKELSYQLNHLTSKIEQFLQWQQYSKNEWAQNIDLFSIGHQRELPFLVQKAQKRIEQWLSQYPYQDSHYYNRLLQWTRLKYRTFTIDERKENPYLQASSLALDQFFVLEKTRQIWDMKNLEVMLKHQYDHGLGEYLEDWLEKPEVDDALRVYLLALRIIDNIENTKDFFHLKSLLQTDKVRLPMLELKDIYTGLLNFCTRRLNTYAEEGFRKEYFEINKELIKNDWLIQDGHLSPWRYINLVNSALALEEIDWVWNFIQTQRSFLPKDIHDNAYQYACGLYHYHNKAYNTAQETLATISFEEPFFNAGMRILLVQVYFDNDETDLLINQLEANRLFLYRDKKINLKRKKQLQQFNTALRKLAKLAPFDKEGHQTLLETLPPPDQIVYRAWLYERIKDRI